MLQFLTIFSICYLSQACSPTCKTEFVNDSLVPSSFNNCVCDQTPTSVYAIILQCTPHYRFAPDIFHNPLNPRRSLKFRLKESGNVVLQKAAVKSCVSAARTIIINQTQFEDEERYYLTEKAMQRAENLESTFSSWVFGFRTNFMQFYKKADSHLRFG